MEKPIILCVDDEEIVLRTLKRELSNAFGEKYIIETAEGGEDALTLFRELQCEGDEIPVVIADQIMPDIKGDDLLRQIHDIAPKTLNIMLTGQADKDAITNAVNQAGLYRYIEKPWEATDLQLTIKEAMRRYFQDKAIEKQIQLLRNMNATLEQKVKERTSQLEAQQVQLTQLNASKDKFFSIIAEDLRTPFTGLLGITDFIVKNVERFSQQEVKESVASMRESTESVYNLLENLLVWAQLQQGVVEYHPQFVSLHEIVERNFAFFASNAAQKQISLTNRISQDIRVYVDKTMLMTVVRNLVSNALKFSHRNGTVTLDTCIQDDFIDVMVADVGVGISKEAFPHLFRIDTKYSTPGTADEEGAGIGLVVCRSLVEKNGGLMRIESDPHQGTVVTVRFPIH
ncbi:hypothetical protein CSA56_11120 [candidate division KSB3 bacterium]|uniref:histidine kinase n=1 Tax=candidate division KSB3 bacterium TaxID=2044937 RepID=A0A2G6KD82_9BACT|nr:MAG: hypothetical protein CSA56_11120 [candidate division KSB3 bacterium]